MRKVSEMSSEGNSFWFFKVLVCGSGRGEAFQLERLRYMSRHGISSHGQPTDGQEILFLQLANSRL